MGEKKGSADKKAQQPRPSRETGVILFSVGAPELCFSTATALQLGADDGIPRARAMPIPPILVDGYVNKSDFDDHHGFVNAFALLPGSYYFEPVILNPYVHRIKTSTFGFTVKAGETVYIGELFMTRSCALSSSFDIRDNYDRDLKIAIEKNPLVGKRQPVKRLMH